MATSPSTALTTLRPDLSGAMEQFDLEADQLGFIGHRIAPVIEVKKAFGQYGVIPLKESLKTQETRRAEDGSYNQTSGKADKDSYSCEEHGLEERVDEREAEVYGEWWDAEMLAAQRTRDGVLRNHEKRIIDLALNVSNTTAAGTEWNDTASSTPVANIRTAKLAVRARTGVVPNVLVIELEIFEFLQSNAEVLDRLFGTAAKDPKKVNEDALARALNLEEVIVAGAMKNTANEAQDAVLGSLWDVTKGLLFRRDANRDTRKPRFMNTFHFGADGSQIGGVVEEYECPKRRSQIVRNRLDTDEKIVYEDCAEVITGLHS